MNVLSIASPAVAGEVLPQAAAVASIGAAVALFLAAVLLRRPHRSLMRTNFRGVELPVVLGIALSSGAAVAVSAAEVLGITDVRGEYIQAALVVLAGLGIAGLWDDLKGDERPRGFGGHLGALRGGRVTGGLVKLILGGVTGIAASWILTDGDPLRTLGGGAGIALSANLLNLFDRAPGRAIKVSLLLAGLIAIVASAEWLVPASSVFGPALSLAWLDLRERGMLGDAGANPLGGVVGMGIATSSLATQAVAVVFLLAVNLASERWSFSRLIDGTPILRAADRLGRRA